MLAIRLQRTGRKGHAQFRIIVQDAHRSPSSGNVVARLGNYDPHTKAVTVDTEKASFYLENGAQPSPRVAYLLQQQGVKLPSWVKIETDKQKSIKNTEKLRRNRPAEVEAPAENEEAPAENEEAPAENEEAPAEEAETTEAPSEETAEATEAPTEEVAATEESSAEPAKEETSEEA